MALADELVKKWQHILDDPWIKSAPTWTEPHCLAYLAEQASKSEYALELGTYIGASALVMLRANPKLHLWTCDHFGAFWGNEAMARHYLSKEIAEHRCEIIVGDSKRAAEMLSHMKQRIDLCFCDDGHEAYQVLADITNCMPLISPNGVFCGHDYDQTNDVAQGVHRSGIKFDIPVPRLWSHQRPKPVVKMLQVHGTEYLDPMIFCEGCGCGHLFPVAPIHAENHRWKWNGDRISPTFEPSMLVNKDGPNRCHSNVIDGVMIFHGDCYHALKNTRVPLKPFV